jgi:tetratricopeptide (TPR) repeat protein
LYVLGHILAKQGDLEAARNAYLQTTLVNPEDSHAFYALGTTCLELDQRPGAIAALEIAVALDPENESFARALEAARQQGKTQ